MYGKRVFDIDEVPAELLDCFEEIETACGAPWARCVEHIGGDTEAIERPKRTAGMDSKTSTLSLSGNGSKEWAERGGKTVTTGWQPTCTCFGHFETVAEPLESYDNPHEPRRTRRVYVPDGPQPEPVSCVVLDPFMGSGTVAAVCIQHNRHYIGFELNEDYVKLAEKRISKCNLPLPLEFA